MYLSRFFMVVKDNTDHMSNLVQLALQSSALDWHLMMVFLSLVRRLAINSLIREWITLKWSISNFSALHRQDVLEQCTF